MENLNPYLEWVIYDQGGVGVGEYIFSWVKNFFTTPTPDPDIPPPPPPPPQNNPNTHTNIPFPFYLFMSELLCLSDLSPVTEAVLRHKEHLFTFYRLIIHFRLMICIFPALNLNNAYPESHVEHSIKLLILRHRPQKPQQFSWWQGTLRSDTTNSGFNLLENKIICWIWFYRPLYPIQCHLHPQGD